MALWVHGSFGAAGCGDGNFTTCGDQPWDYRYGDRCALGAIPKEGALVADPPSLRLTPSADGVPSTGRITVIGYAERNTRGQGLVATPADGYFVDIAILGGTDEAPEPDCQLALELAPTIDADLCVVETPSNLRCLLDPTGVTEIEVSTTHSYATAELCRVYVQSGPKNSSTEVSVNQDPADLDLAIHFGIGDDGCGDSATPCVGQGGRLPQAVCTTGVAECTDLATSTPFYLTIEHEGAQVPIAREMSFELDLIDQHWPSTPAWIKSVPDCSDDQQSYPISTSGQSDTIYLCIDGGSGDFEIQATSTTTTDLADSVFVSLPEVPAKLTLTPDEAGVTEGSSAYYKLDVESCEGRGLEEELEVTDGDGTRRVVSGTYFPVPLAATELSVSFERWDRTCILPIPTL